MTTKRRIPRAYRGVPPAGQVTERSINTILGDILREKHPRWFDRIETERSRVFKENSSLIPDILIRHPGGVPVIVETKFHSSSQKGSKGLEVVEVDAVERLALTMSEGGYVVEQAIAVRLSDEIRHVSQNQLDEKLRCSSLEYCVFSGTRDSYQRWPIAGWIIGDLDDLACCIEQVALSEERITRGMTILEEGVSDAASILYEGGADAPEILETISDYLHQKPGDQTLRMAMAILSNALTFHTAIAGSRGIPPIDQLRTGGGRVSKSRVLAAWRHILENINYWPIFRIASDILLPVRNGTANKILARLASVASELADLGATSQQELCCRMFQRLISDRKFLATFYTLPSSAALLAELAVTRFDIDWQSRAAVESLRIADFACGTGALLNAAYGAILCRYRRAGGDDMVIHPQMMEDSLVGADIMPAATHLTASALSSAYPSIPFQHTSIVTLPYGQQSLKASQRYALGALDLIDGQSTRALFDLGQERMKGGARGHSGNVELPHYAFDLVIMNPPFTRPTNHARTNIPVPSFAGFSTSEREQEEMSKRLASVRTQLMAGHGNAGLASNFFDIANMKVRNGGVIAMVLPSVLLQGSAWSGARRLLEERYSEIIIVSIADIGAINQSFSADTEMAEILVIATRKNPTKKQRGSTLFVNFERRPRTVLEAVNFAKSITHISATQNSGKMMNGSREKVGCYIRGKLSQAGGAGVREVEVAFAASKLTNGQVRLAQWRGVADIPIAALSTLGNRGALHRDINGKERKSNGERRGPFDLEKLVPGDMPSYPILWGHSADREKTLVVDPDCQGIPREEDRSRANRLWNSTASRLHFTLDYTLSSQPLAACITCMPTMGGTAWPNILCEDKRWENVLVLWANTTLGLIVFWWIGARQQQGRARLTVSRLPTLPVLNARALSHEQLELADSIFDNFRSRELLPANEAWHDETRQYLDRSVLVDLLQLPEDMLEPLALLRRQWCAEPSVHGGKGTRPPT